MRYIAEILSGGVSVDSLTFPISSEGVKVLIRDTYSGAAEWVALGDTIEDDVLGIHVDYSENGARHVLKLSHKEAIFQSYVERCKTYGKGHAVFGEADQYYLESKQGFVVTSVGSRVANVLSAIEAIDALGCAGCIINTVYRWDSDKPPYTSLYNFIGNACRTIGVNLLQYELLQFSTIMGDSVTDVKFMQTPEARRFLVKASFDMMRK